MSLPRAVSLVILAIFIGCGGSNAAGLKSTSQPAPSEQAKQQVAAEQKTHEPAKQPAKAKQPAEQQKESQYLDPNNPKSILYTDTKGNLAGTGDPAKSGIPSEAVKIGAGWHPQALAANILPKDKYGLVDWVKAVKENLIVPRASLDPKEEEMPPLDMNVVIEAKSDFVNDVVYPHYIHTWWLKCEVCHPKIFTPAKGQNNMTMAGIAQGQWCGRCHGKVSFPLTDCMRCHVQPKKAAKK